MVQQVLHMLSCLCSRLRTFQVLIESTRVSSAASASDVLTVGKRGTRVQVEDVAVNGGKAITLGGAIAAA